MRIAGIFALLLIGFVAGWVVRDLTGKQARQRAPKSETRAPRGPVVVETDRNADLEVAATPVAAPGPVSPVIAPEADPEQPGEAQEDPIEKWVRAQSTQWKAWASMQSSQRLEALLKELGFDEATARAIEEAIAKEAERQTERAIQMFLGEEALDPDAFGYFMGLPPELSPELEGELATFLNDGEIDELRQGFKKAHDKQMRNLADMQIGMMPIPDMTADQRQRMQDLFSSKNLMAEQLTQFAEFTSDRGKMRDLIQGKTLNEAMERQFAPTRDLVKEILTPQQMEGYRKYEQMLIQQAEVGIKMFGALLEQPEAKKK
jgi:Spy/CpxP family protein refolding chaperone